MATLVGSGIMAERLAGGNQAIALLGNAIPTGAILVVIIIMFFGSEPRRAFHPAVALARGFTSTFTGTAINHIPAFIMAQLMGPAFGAGVASALFGPTIASKGK